MKTHRAVVWWLRVVAAFVVATLVVGGATRITDSGLSITEWAPILGVVPPLTDAGWEAALALYREIPEYQLINRGMAMGDFQVIYLWEWAHRLIARAIGLVFLVPFVIFWVRGMLPGWSKPWGLVLFALGGLQGVVGWWMVTSGLTERVDVSQYRLAVHLTLACVILAIAVWLSERLAAEGMPKDGGSLPASVRVMSRLIPIALLGQIALGALVAGIDAGLASDTWPLMMGAFVPDGLGALSPGWLNAFENPLAVQFNHRMWGYVVLAAAAVNAVLCWRADVARTRALLLLSFVLFQAISGILVVVLQVPPVLAGTHQAIAAVTLCVAVVHAARTGQTGRTAHRAVSLGMAS